MDNLDNMDTNSDNIQDKSQNQFSESGYNDKSSQGSKSSKGGCGCGCKASPADDEVVDIEEEDWNY